MFSRPNCWEAISVYLEVVLVHELVVQRSDRGDGPRAPPDGEELLGAGVAQGGHRVGHAGLAGLLQRKNGGE